MGLCGNENQDLGEDKWPGLSFFLKYNANLSHQSAKLKPEQSSVRHFKIQRSICKLLCPLLPPTRLAGSPAAPDSAQTQAATAQR